MPKRGSELLKFIKEALINETYSNLQWVDEEQQIFRLLCIHKNNKDWPEEYGYIFKDWHNIKKRKRDKNLWNDMYQRLLQALQKGPLIKKIKSATKDFYYHFVPVDRGPIDPGPVGANRYNIAAESIMEIDLCHSAKSPDSGYGSNVDDCNWNDLVGDCQIKTEECESFVDCSNENELTSEQYEGVTLQELLEIFPDGLFDDTIPNGIVTDVEETLVSAECKELLGMFPDGLFDDTIPNGIVTDVEETLESAEQKERVSSTCQMESRIC